MAVKGKYVYEWPRPLVTVDSIVWSLDEERDFKVLLVRRKNDPYKGLWALPGGYLEMDESAISGAKRELKEETGLTDKGRGILFGGFFEYRDAVDRDPRGRTISFVFDFFCHPHAEVKPGDDAEEVKWFPMDNLPDMAFDHKEIIDKEFEILSKNKKKIQLINSKK